MTLAAVDQLTLLTIPFLLSLASSKRLSGKCPTNTMLALDRLWNQTQLWQLLMPQLFRLSLFSKSWSWFNGTLVKVKSLLGNGWGERIVLRDEGGKI